MGQCMSRKAAGALAASTTAAHNRPTTMNKQKLTSPDEDNNKPPLTTTTNNSNETRKAPACSKGVAMSFGFKRRAAPIASNESAARRLAGAASHSVDRNGNAKREDIVPLTEHAVPSGRTTPKLAPPKKEASATKTVSRFGFRHNQVNRLNKVADLNNQQALEYGNNNMRPRPNSTVTSSRMNANDNNRNRLTAKVGPPQPQIGRYTLQTNQLPRPEPIRLIETKTAKTLANNNRKVAMYYHTEESSSKDGSLTEDSGVGSNHSGYLDHDTGQEVKRLEASPSFGRRLHHRAQKPRHLEVVVTGGNTFDLRDLSDSSESIVPIPKLPSAFSSVDKNKSSYHNSGFVRERTLEYQRHLDREKLRKISVTSSEGFSDDYYGEDEKTLNERCKSEKLFLKNIPPKYSPETKTSPPKSFLKSRPNCKELQELKEDSSPTSSDQEWGGHGGEAMADEISFSLSSSDESKDKAYPPAAKRNGTLLEDETMLSPVSLLSSSETEELIRRKMNQSSSNSKDINEKLTPSSPGTPTNASNSLSLSDGKDDFLIDDEIADQPALVFEDTIAIGPNDTITMNGMSLSQSISQNMNLSQNNSENTATIVDSTPRPRRRNISAFDGSPLLGRRRFMRSRTGSVDTLSPCESIASDDLMMDYDYSQSSGMEDIDRQSSGYPSLNDTMVKSIDVEVGPDDIMGIRGWASIMNNYTTEVKKRSMKNGVIRTNKTTELRYQRSPSVTRKDSTSATNKLDGSPTPLKHDFSNASRTRLLRSRNSTPNSIPDSPKSLDSRITARSRPSATSSPVKPRLSLLSNTGGYDSDDSIRLDRANHTAMKQDIISIKTMLLKLRRVLNEQTDEDLLLRSETHNPFESQSVLTNGLFNSLCENGEAAQFQDDDEARQELAELRRQVLFLQGQLEDKDKTVNDLQEQMVKLATDNYHANSAPASTVSNDNGMCNAATQTERMRPISAGPSLLNGSSLESSSAGSLVSANEHRRSRPPIQGDSPASKRTPSRLWRKPGEPPSPQRYALSPSPSHSSSSSIPRRANSQTRAPSSYS